MHLADATLTTRVNNKVENYGIIQIFGLMRVKNPEVDAFTNTGGLIFVESSGELIIKP